MRTATSILFLVTLLTALLPACKEEKVGAGFDYAKIAAVASGRYRNALKARLDAFGGDPKKAFTGKNSLENFGKMRIVGTFTAALLLIRNADKFEFSKVFRLGSKAEFVTPVAVIAAGVEIFCIGLETGQLYPKHIADINIAFENLGIGFGTLNLVRAVLTVKNIAVFNVRACPPGDVHRCFRIIGDADKNVVGLRLRASDRFF